MSIEVQDVSKAYGSKRLFQEVNVRFDAGRRRAVRLLFRFARRGAFRFVAGFRRAVLRLRFLAGISTTSSPK